MDRPAADDSAAGPADAAGDPPQELELSVVSDAAAASARATKSRIVSPASSAEATIVDVMVSDCSSVSTIRIRRPDRRPRSSHARITATPRGLVWLELTIP